MYEFKNELDKISFIESISDKETQEAIYETLDGPLMSFYSINELFNYLYDELNESDNTNNTLVRKITTTSKFKKDYKAVQSQPNFKKDVFNYVVDLLQKGEKLPEKYYNHVMRVGGHKYEGYNNCHISPNIILIYELTPDSVNLIRIGSHNKLELTN